MRKIETIKVYNLVDSKGNNLRLDLGRITTGVRDECPISSNDKGFRWRFVGKRIPMPVRSEYWFNGFPDEIMLDWLKGNGWYPRTCVCMSNGTAVVYDLPKGDEDVDYPALDPACKPLFDHHICELLQDGRRGTACRIYRYAHGGSVYDALKAIEEIGKNR